MRERIFIPLGMKDTAFFVPQEKLGRLATVYTTDAKNPSLSAVPHDAGVSKAPGLPSGGGGLYSTAGDYLRFAQMLLNGGKLNDARILAPSTVQLMRSNHLPERLMTGKFGIGLYTMQPGLGFGYDFAVFEDPVKLGSTAGRRNLSLGWRRRHVVLDRSDERRCICGHDSAHDDGSRSAEYGRSFTRASLPGPRGSQEVRHFRATAKHRNRHRYRYRNRQSDICF